MQSAECRYDGACCVPPGLTTSPASYRQHPSLPSNHEPSERIIGSLNGTNCYVGTTRESLRQDGFAASFHSRSLTGCGELERPSNPFIRGRNMLSWTQAIHACKRSRYTSHQTKVASQGTRSAEKLCHWLHGTSRIIWEACFLLSMSFEGV